MNDDDKYVAYVVHRYTAWFCLALTFASGISVGIALALWVLVPVMC